MKKRLCSLLTALVLVCTTFSVSVSAALSVLEPLEFLQDFEDESILVGENYTGAQIQQMTNVPMQLTGEPNIYASIEEEESGNKVLRVHPSAEAHQVDSLYVLDGAMPSGKLEAGFEFAPDSDSDDAWHFLGITDSNGTSESVISYQQGGWKKTSEATDGTLLSGPTRNENGRFVLRIELSRTGSSGAWTVKLYDEATQTPTLIYEGKTAETFRSIAKIKPIRLYAVAAVAATFDNYLVRATYFPTVLAEDDGLSGVYPDVSPITVGFNAALPKPDDKVSIIKVNDTETVIETQTDYDSESGRLTITPESYFEYDTEYIMSFESGGVANHNFTTAPRLCSIVEQTITYIPDGGSEISDKPQVGTFKTKVSLKIKNTTQVSKRVTVVYLAYDADGAVIGAKTKNVTVPQNHVGYPTNVTITDLDATEFVSSGVVLWENDDIVGYVPLS